MPEPALASVTSADSPPSPQQQRAIEAPLGPVLVLAGPGAGKTFCLVERVRHLIEAHGARPSRICAVTFTNKAAEEVVRRLHRELGAAAFDVTRGTLHSLCAGMLREHAELVGLRRGFGIADEDYQQTLLRRLGVRPRKRRAWMLGLFSRKRLQDYRLEPDVDAVFDRYVAALRERNMADFDDLLVLVADLFERHPEVAAAQAARWDHLLVDEFQDLSPVQYGIVTRLAEPHHSLFAVGDDEQSIFSWTGADPEVIRRFRTDYGVEPIVLDQNRRSARAIFAVARRLVERNPRLFDKRLEALRESPFAVEVQRFPDESAEAGWILSDIARDRAAHGFAWGEVAVLYRRHDIGRELERRFLQAGVPCRMARGRAISDDPVIGQVTASLRVIADPEDPVALEALAAHVLPDALLERVRTASRRGEPFLDAVRRVARDAHGDQDGRWLWRFVYQVENLRALVQGQDSLGGLVTELLGERMGKYRNPLEEHLGELVDPAVYPGAQEIADALRAARESGGTVWVASWRGLEIGIRGLLVGSEAVHAVRVLGEGDKPAARDLVLRPDDADPGELVVRVFKALQLDHVREPGGGEPFSAYVTFDLETTGTDVQTCEIVEIGAALVEQGRVVDTFHSLVRPDGPVPASATEVHGYTDADLAAAPHFAEVWPRFRAFIGSRVLVAHNGQRFDVPVLRRLAGATDLVFFDTLPLARALSDQSAKLEALAERFGVPLERAHHAQDDAVALAGVLSGLWREKQRRARTTALVNLLDQLGLSLALADDPRTDPERRALADVAYVYALGRYSSCLDEYERERDGRADAPAREVLIERLGGLRLLERLRAERSAAERYPSAVARLEALVEASAADTLTAGIRRLLERVALSTSDGIDVDPDRVNLLTLHSTKGLEFSRVYIVGVEDEQLPGGRELDRAATRDIEEARRVLYVGMTRAMDRLVLTRAETRFGKPGRGSLFLEEMGFGV
ncbi:MAG TPA: UvrD-helicase domain-containing protein [Gemmatimonadales bacterium]|nr:UvrD-helicase domain-containing protein [Gemmatimonadales bacterium]